MFWLYMPPIIFIAALVVLAVILGKKTAALKKSGFLHRKEVVHSERGTVAKERFKRLGVGLLKFLEWVINAIKAGAKSSEAGLSNALGKIKEKRLGKSRNEDLKSGGEQEKDVVRYIMEDKMDAMRDETLGDEITEKQSDMKGEKKTLFDEVIVKRKPEIIPQRIVRERELEDKVREDALIHRIAENPKDIEAYRELGDYYLAIGNLKDAKDSFKMVLKLRPRDLKAKSSLRDMEMRIRLGEKI